MISKTRWVVERTFGSLKRWFGIGVTHLKGIAKTHSLHVLEAIAHNLKRSPGLVRQVVKSWGKQRVKPSEIPKMTKNKKTPSILRVFFYSI